MCGNVISFYKPLVKPTIILDRHYIWSNILITKKKFNRIGNWRAMTSRQLCDVLNIDFELISYLDYRNWTNHDKKRQILRNCVLPEIGKHILDNIENDISLEKWLYI